MRKFLIYLTSFLFLFGVSTAFAGVYSEDFEDEDLDPPWYASGDYDITTVPGGSTGLHMNRACDTCGGYTEVGTNTNELIYHFAADIYLPTNINSNLGVDMDLFHWREGGDSFELWSMFYLDGYAIHAVVHLYDSDGQLVDQLSESLGPYDKDVLYSLSITINDGCVTFGVDGIVLTPRIIDPAYPALVQPAIPQPSYPA